MSQANHSKAPICAAFVQNMRELFGEVKVLHVNEGEVRLGEKQPDGAPCIHRGDGSLFSEPEKKRRAA